MNNASSFHVCVCDSFFSSSGKPFYDGSCSSGVWVTWAAGVITGACVCVCVCVFVCVCVCACVRACLCVCPREPF